MPTPSIIITTGATAKPAIRRLVVFTNAVRSCKSPAG